MTHRTAPPAAAAGQAQMPPDVETMRASVRRLLAPDAKPITPGDLETLTLALRGHIELLIPEVEAAARQFPHGDVPKACALAGVGEARMRLRLGPGEGAPVRMSVAMKLARSVNALCDHLENLGNQEAATPYRG